jgi:glycosyltransferase involved in cell wall biosynthesis
MHTSPLYVTVDYSSAMTHSAGIARYTRELVRALHHRPDAVRLRLIHHLTANHVETPTDAPALQALRFTARSWRMFCLFAPKRMARRALAGAPIDVMHGPDSIVPSLDVPTVLTIHDVTCLSHPQFHSRFNRLYQRVALPVIARRATRIMADSKSTATEIERLLHVDRKKIDVVYPGIRTDIFRPQDRRKAQVEVAGVIGTNAPYVLALGTLEPRKNLATLLHSFARIAGDIPHDLVLVGKSGWGDTRLNELAEKFGIRGRVRFTGFVADELLPALYSGADVFVFPSHYEGFGFPVLEAMACGAPVVCSDNSSLPEVGGDKALYASAAEPDLFAAHIRRIIGEPNLSAKLRAGGQVHAAAWTWNRTTDEVIEVYRRVRRRV